MDETTTSLPLFAETTATVPANAAPLKLEAKALIDGKEFTQVVTGGVPKLIERGDLATTTDLAEVVIRPGAEVRVDSSRRAA